MLTLYYSPQTRATRIIGLLMKMGRLDDVEIKTVQVQRSDGAGGKDPVNPHPEGKVPYLVHNGEEIRESAAVILYLTDVFGGPMAPAVGEKGRGAYLSWLAYYQGVIEPVLILQFLSMSGANYADIFAHPVIESSLRGPAEIEATLSTALRDRPFLLGDTFTAVDLLMASPYQWMPDAIPDDPLVKAWAARCAAEIDQPAIEAFEAAAMKTLA